MPFPTPPASGDAAPGLPTPLHALGELLQRACAGCAPATARLVEILEPLVLRAARRYLTRGHVLRRGFESADLTQEVWRNLLSALSRGTVPGTPAHFLRFTVTVVRGTFLHLYRDHLTRGKRSLRREQPLNPLVHDRPARGEMGADPAERAATEDEWAHWLGALSGPEADVLCALRAGERLAGVADRLGLSVRTVGRLVRQIRLKLSARAVAGA
jgi:RNA polymerase sigma factor (sigma-70 family)